MPFALPDDIGASAPILRPTASPVDTFSQTKAGVQLAQLGSALSGFAPSLAHLGGVLQEKDNEKQTIAGQNKAQELIDSGKTWKKAVDEGFIHPGDNPFFLVAAKNQFGKTLGNKYGEDLEKAVKLGPIASSWNADDFLPFEANFRKDWVKKNLGDGSDAYTINAFNHTATENASAQEKAFAHNALGRMVNDSKEMRGGEMVGEINKALTAGTPETIPDALNAIILRGRATGLPFTELNGMARDAIVSVAQEMASNGKGFEGLKLLDSVSGPLSKMATPGGTVGNIPDIKNSITAARKEIATLTQVQFSREKEQRTFAVTQTRKKLLNSVEQAAIAAKEAGQPPPDIGEAAKTLTHLNDEAIAMNVDVEPGTVISQLRKIVDSVYSGKPSTPAVRDDLASRIANGDGVTQKELSDKLHIGSLSFEDYEKLSSRLTTATKEHGDRRLSDHAYGDIAPVVAAQTMVKDRNGNQILDGARYEQVRMRSEAAYDRWVETSEGASASPAARIEKAQSLIDGFMDIYGTAGKMNSGLVTPKIRTIRKAGDGIASPVAAPLDPTKGLVSTPDSITALIKDVRNWQLNPKTAKLSPATLHILQTAGIKPGPDVLEFIKAQSPFLKQTP